MRWLEWFGYRPSPTAFGRRMARDFTRDSGRDWQYDAEADVLRSAEGSCVHLSNLRRAYLQLPPWQRGAYVRRWSGGRAVAESSLPALWIAARSRLRTVLRSPVDLALAAIEHGGRSPLVPVTAPFAGDLERRLVFDFEHHMGIVARDQLEVWGIGADEALDTGTRNLAGLARPTWQDVGDGLHQLMSPEGYAEGFVQLDSSFRELPFAPRAVIAIPNRGRVLAVDGDSPAALQALVEAVRQSLEDAPWPMSATLFARDGDGWRVLDAPAPVRELARWWLASTYAEQKQALDQHHEATATDVFVASCGLLRRGAEQQTWCTWGEDVDTLLPRTDLIALGRQSRDAVLVTWEQAEAQVGHLLGPPQGTPPRHRVQAFPDEQQWQALAAVGERFGPPS